MPATESHQLESLPVLTSAQWKRLPLAEKDRLRALKHAHRATQSPQAASPPATDDNSTPFRDIQKRPLYLQNLYRGASCFIVLAGPSAQLLDLSQLNRRGIFTLSVNNSPAVFRPNCWTHVDPLWKFHESTWKDPGTLKIVNHRNLRASLRSRKPDGSIGPLMRRNISGQMVQALARDMPGVIGDIRNASFDPATYLPQPSVCWGVSKRWHIHTKRPRCLNVMFAVVKHAYALGFRAVYLLGCDFSMQQNQPYAFPQGKSAGAVGGSNNGYQIMNSMFSELLPFFDAAGFHVYNCNPRSGLTVFPHVPYQEAIEAATSHVPQDPLNTEGWYDRKPATS